MIKSILKVVIGFLFKVKVSEFNFKQYENQKKIIIANHQSFLDGLVIGLFIPLDMIFVVNTDIAKNFWFKQILRLVNYLPVDPTNPMAMKQIIKLVNEGKTLVIFPEGRITVTGSLMKIYEGTAFIAAKTEALIIPVSLQGLTLSYMSRVSKLYPQKIFPKISIHISHPKVLKLSENHKSKDQRKIAAKQMKNIMQEVIFESEKRITLYNSLLNNIEQFGINRKILEDKDLIQYTYKDILKRSIGVGKIVEKFTNEKEIIGILLPNTITTVASIFGLNLIDRIPAMLNFTVGKDGIENACKVANIKKIITSRAFIEIGKLDYVKDLTVEVLYLEDLKETLTVNDKISIGISLIFNKNIEKNPSNEKIGYILFTSGSEGTPKGVVLTQDNILANINQIRSIIDINPTDKVFNALPMFHSFGLTGGTMLPLLSGTNVFLYPSPLHNRIIPEIIYDKNCTILFGTSTFLNNYAKFANEYDFRSIRYVVAGAEKLSDEVKNIWFENFGIRIFEGYGTTELSPVVSVNTPMAFKSGTVGKLLPGLDYRLKSIPGIEDGGQLFLKGPNVMKGYLKINNPGVIEETTSEFGEGWYDTGDIVSINELGFVTIKGRTKRFAKIAGEMISLEKVEMLGQLALDTDEQVCLAVNLPDKQKGEMIIIFTTIDIDRPLLIKTAQENGIPLIAVPKHIFYIEKFPLLGTGKTDYVKLKEMALSLITKSEIDNEE
jgi:acyl-[acyl-carrier-protein]-phospholipid O-acyltransferase/long-chain-fatty-acid--[acyl-carrier-protein] ligase